MILGDVYSIGSSSYKLKRENVARNYQQWQTVIDDMLAVLKKSDYYNEAVKMQLVPRPITDHTLTDLFKPPVPAGRTWQQRREDVNQFIRNHPNADLSTLLLPISPSDERPKTNIPLTEILTDLSFQLK